MYVCMYVFIAGMHPLDKLVPPRLWQLAHLEHWSGEVAGVSSDLPEDLAVEFVLQRTVLQAGVDDVLDGLDVEAEVVGGQLGGEELADTAEQLLRSHIERGGREGC